MHIKNWFDGSPKVKREWARYMHSDENKSDASTYQFWFDEYRLHEDYIINIVDDDEFDLRYHVWEVRI